MLNHNSKDKWGNPGDQGYLWPPMWQKSPENLNPPSIGLLELQGVHATSRAIILNFGTLHFQVRLLNVTLWIVLFWSSYSLHTLLTLLCNVSTSTWEIIHSLKVYSILGKGWARSLPTCSWENSQLQIQSLGLFPQFLLTMLGRCTWALAALSLMQWISGKFTVKSSIWKSSPVQLLGAHGTNQDQDQLAFFQNLKKTGPNWC